MTATLVFSVLASVGVLLTQWLYGNKSVCGPIAGLVSQAPWLGLIITTGAWGLLLSWVPMTAIHARNLHKWRHNYDQA